MTSRRTLVFCAAALTASASGSHAGPCSYEITRVQIDIDAKLQAQAAAGPSTRESTAATVHRQPTPHSIGAAESRLDEVSPEKLNAVRAAMVRARSTDDAGDQTTQARPHASCRASVWVYRRRDHRLT
jgi:hypothetical protein